MARGAKQKVLDALAETLLAGDARKLRVAELLQDAGVNRSTFYYHFNSLNDAYDQLVDEGLAPIDSSLALSYNVNRRQTSQEFFEAQLSFFTYCKEHDRIYHALLWGDLRDRFLSAFVDHIELFLAKNCRVTLGSRLPGRNMTDDDAYQMLFYRALAYQQFSILETWAALDFEQPPELVAEVACLVILPNRDLCSLDVKRSARTHRVT